MCELTATGLHLSFWRDLLQLLEGSMSRDAIALWIMPLRPILVSSDKIVLEVPNRIHERFVRERYLEIMRRCARALRRGEMQIDFILAPERQDAGDDLGALRLPTQRHKTRLQTPSLNRNYTFESFVVGRCNKAAYSAARAAAERPGKKNNPLFITGGVGLGKTHLLQAIGARMLDSGNGSFTYITSDQLMDELMRAYQDRTIARVRKRLASVAILLVDDIHFLSGRNQIQEEFFTIFNTLHEKRSQIVLSSDRPPKEIPRLHQRLVSRFQGGSLVELKPPALATRLAILERKAHQLTLELPRLTLMLLASRIRTNIRLMEGTLNRIAAYASLTGGLPDAPALEELLRDTMVDGEGANITIRRIQKKVAEHFRITIATLLGKERSSRIAFPRQIAMYLCRAIVQSPYADIGAAFAGRDHTTAIHACRTMGDLLRGSSEAREIVDELTTAIRS